MTIASSEAVRPGSVPATVQTNANGKASATYTSGMAPNDATTTIATVTATAGGNEGSAEVYNFRGFPEYTFHQTQLPDARFTAHTEWSVTDVQSFFVARNSFFAKFYLVGSQGDRGFFDTNGNGNYNSGEPKYCADGTDCSMSGSKTSAAQAFANAAKKQGQRVNPKLLLVQAQKEQSLISSATLPPTQTLNEAFGCPAQTYNTFQKQLDCAANTMADHFNTAPGMPYFFPGTTPNNSIQHFVYNPQAGSLGHKVVGFTLNSNGTYALYKYTPHITTSQGGGGNYLFEEVWKQYGF